MRVLISLAVVLCGLIGPVIAHAQTITPAGKDPVEITADGAIEWQRDAHLYRVRGNAMVKQGDTTIKADTIDAAYDPAQAGHGGEQNIQTVTAIGHVNITSKDRTITADKGVYNLISGQLMLTGGDLRITSPVMTITAQQSLSYNKTENKASARGNAVVKTPDRTLKAEQIDAWFTAENDLSKASARGRVTITTQQDILQAEQADYNAVTQEAVMTGEVKLTRGQNHLQGGRAIVNLKTGVSQLFGDTTQDAASGGRVRALFYPGSNTDIMPGKATDSLIPMRPGTKTRTLPVVPLVVPEATP